MKLEKMSRDERSLLLYFECCAVDNGGLTESNKMNKEDFEIAEKWNKSGFISFSRLTYKSIQLLVKKNAHRVFLSEDAWKLAHQERRARSDRMNKREPWCDLITTKTKNARYYPLDH